MTENYILSAQIGESIPRLQEWIKNKSFILAQNIGFGWYINERLAPTTYPALQANLQNCIDTGQPYPVAEKGNESSFYDRETNAAFRFTHDLKHAELGMDFTPQGELVVATAHLIDISEDFEFGGLEWQLLFADTIGQVIYGVRHEAYVKNQTVFAINLIMNGIEAAIQIAKASSSKKRLEPLWRI